MSFSPPVNQIVSNGSSQQTSQQKPFFPKTMNLLKNESAKYIAKVVSHICNINTNDTEYSLLSDLKAAKLFHTIICDIVDQTNDPIAKEQFKRIRSDFERDLETSQLIETQRVAHKINPDILKSQANALSTAIQNLPEGQYLSIQTGFAALTNNHSGHSNRLLFIKSPKRKINFAYIDCGRFKVLNKANKHEETVTILCYELSANPKDLTTGLTRLLLIASTKYTNQKIDDKKPFKATKVTLRKILGKTRIGNLGKFPKQNFQNCASYHRDVQLQIVLGDAYQGHYIPQLQALCHHLIQIALSKAIGHEKSVLAFLKSKLQ